MPRKPGFPFARALGYWSGEERPHDGVPESREIRCQEDGQDGAKEGVEQQQSRGELVGVYRISGKRIGGGARCQFGLGRQHVDAQFGNDQHGLELAVVLGWGEYRVAVQAPPAGIGIEEEGRQPADCVGGTQQGQEVGGARPRGGVIDGVFVRPDDRRAGLEP